MHVAIIGAGASGLASARRVTDPKYGHTCEIFERSDELGGLWVYGEEAGVDKYGLPVHSAMTNTPKEMMGYIDYDYPEMDKSYLTSEEVLNFLKSYADQFNLHKNIKYHHFVKSVRPIENERWELRIEDLEMNEEVVKEFDAVMICTGHYHHPLYPEFERGHFKGFQIHSHEFRVPDPFVGQAVLVVGGGLSGCDVANFLLPFAKKVYVSHTKEETMLPLLDTITLKTELIGLADDCAIFSDGTNVEVDSIIYCTGYKYSFPFLTEECGVRVTDKQIYPLYRQLLNVEHPTMCFIGIPTLVSIIFQMFDLQASFFAEILSGKHKLATKEEMLDDIRNDEELRLSKGFTKNEMHKLGLLEHVYYKSITDISELKPIRPVYEKLFTRIRQKLDRNDKFKIIDDENFIELRS